MKIKGLPASIWKGSHEVFFRGKPCPLLQVCHHCKYVHPAYFYCANGHVTCVDCQTRNKANCEQAPCKTCNGPSSRITVSTNLIEDLDFSCGCGYLGTLFDLKIHKASDVFDEDCDTPPEHEDPSIIEYKMELDELEMVSISLRSDIQTRLDRIRTMYDQYGIEIVDRKKFEELERRIEYVTRESELVLEEYQESQEAFNQIRPILDAVASPWTRKSFPVDALAAGGIKREIIETQKFQISISLAGTSEGQADLYVEASFKRGTVVPPNVVGQLLLVRHLDSSGFTVNEASFRVQKDGTLGDPRNKQETAGRMQDLDNHWRVPNFIDNSYLIGPASRISRLIHISADICS